MNAAVLAAPPVASHFRSRDGQAFTIRPCVDLLEVDSCVDLQQATWGYPDREVVPRNLYVLAQALGGHVLGAWDQRGTLAGFAMAVAAHEPVVAGRWMQPVGARVGGTAGQPHPPSPYLHSHMLAIAPPYQNNGLGYALKLAQREDALQRGIRTMRWTFDPLMARNAWFNLGRIGARASRYIVDFYGQLGSKLQGGLPTDRLVAEWDLLKAPGSQEQFPAAQPPDEAQRRISLPAMVVRRKTQGALRELLELQARLRNDFQEAFAQGMQIQGFRRFPDGHGEYLLYASGKTE